MVRRPIINTRDEPHSDSAKYRRLHVIVGDANMAELSTYLKVGTLSIVLELLEAGAELHVFAFYSACHALGLVEQISLPSALQGSRLASAVAAPAQPAPPPRGLFQRLLGKLLGARLNEDATG